MAAASRAGTAWVRVNLAAGTYDARHLPDGYACKGRHLILKARGSVRIGPLAGLPSSHWQTDGSGVFWQTLARPPVRIVDERFRDDAQGGGVTYARQRGLSECRAVAGSWAWADQVLYIHAPDGEAPGADLVVLLEQDNLEFRGGLTLVLDGGEHGIELLGGQEACLKTRENLKGSLLVLRNVWMRYSKAKNLDVLGVSSVIMLGGGSSDAATDNLSYHRTERVVPRVMEVGVKSYRAGTNGAGNNNASTAHDGCSVVRVSGHYHGADGPVVADVGDGTRSWNVLCRAGGSRREAGPIRAAWLASSGDARIWLDRCTQDPDEGYDITVSGIAVAYVRDTAVRRTYGEVRAY